MVSQCSSIQIGWLVINRTRKGKRFLPYTQKDGASATKSINKNLKKLIGSEFKVDQSITFKQLFLSEKKHSWYELEKDKKKNIKNKKVEELFFEIRDRLGNHIDSNYFTAIIS